MARVAVGLRIMPEDAGVDLAALRERVRASFGQELRDVAERPVAFGLVALEAVLLLEDTEGRLEAAEDLLRGLEGVGNVETLSVDLL